MSVFLLFRSISEDAISHECFSSVPPSVTAQSVPSNEITPEDCPPHKIDVLKVIYSIHIHTLKQCLPILVIRGVEFSGNG